MKNLSRKMMAVLLCAAMLLTLAIPAMAEETVYHVGVIQLLEHQALDAATQGFVDALKEKLGDNVEIEVQVAQGEVANCATIANKFVNDNVDLIMANATPALTSACAATGSIPVLGTSVTDYVSAGVLDDAENPGGNVSGTSDLAPIDQQIAMLQELCPEAKHVGIVFCSSEANSEFQAVKAEEYLAAAGLTSARYTVSDSSEIQNVVTKAVGEVDVLYIPTDNTLADNMEIVKNITVPAKMPVIAGEENMCAVGGLATLSISYYDLGHVTGEMAYEILAEGADVGSMAVRYAGEVTRKYNAEIAEAIGIEIPADLVAIGE